MLSRLHQLPPLRRTHTTMAELRGKSYSGNIQSVSIALSYDCSPNPTICWERVMVAHPFPMLTRTRHPVELGVVRRPYGKLLSVDISSSQS